MAGVSPKLRLSRRRVMRSAVAASAGLLVAACAGAPPQTPIATAPTPLPSPTTAQPAATAPPNPTSLPSTPGHSTDPTDSYLARLDLAAFTTAGADYAASANRQVEAAAFVGQLLDRYQGVDRQRVLEEVFRRLTAGAGSEIDRHRAVLYFVQKLSVHNLASPFFSLGHPVWDPVILFEVNVVDCQGVSRLIADLYAAGGYESRLVDMYGHVVAELKYDGAWHYADADFFGGGQVVTVDGQIPSMAELSKRHKLLDALPTYLENAVLSSYQQGSGGKNGAPMGWSYPAYNYFGKAYFAQHPGYPVYLYKDRGTAPKIDRQMMFGWDKYSARESASDVVLGDVDERDAPGVPQITAVAAGRGSASLSFVADDPQHNVGGYEVLVSRRSRGWDYGAFVGSAAARRYWANPAGWRPEMYDSLFKLPPSEVARLRTSTGDVVVPGLSAGRYFISVMPTDGYGESVGKQLFVMSNEIVLEVG